MKPAPTKEASASSPFAGCAILITALLVMMFLVVFSIVVLFRQYEAIAKFTVEKAAPVEISPVGEKSNELAALQAKLDAFHALLKSNESASLELSADEINLAIAAYEPFKDLRGLYRVMEIGDETLHIAISFQLNGKPRLTKSGESGLFTSDPRFLNATMITRPTLSKGEFVLRIDDIQVPGAEVPKEFIENMAPYGRVTQNHVNDPTLGPAMAKLTRVGLAGGKLVLGRVPSETPADMITNDQVDAARNRLFTVLGVAACLFLVLVGLILFIGLRAKAAKL